MLLHQLLALALAPALASAAIFPPGSPVKSLDAKGFKKAMKESRTSLVAFVAPWCGHCQKLAGDYSKAAKSLNPLVPLYAVDCDAAENKALCAEEKIEGFPTVKLFPRGGKKPPVLYQGERTTTAIVDFVSQRLPYTVKKLTELDSILSWIIDGANTPRALLLTKDKKVPMLWKVLSNKYDKLNFGVHRDTEGTMAATLGVEFDSEDTGSKVLVFPAGSTSPARFEGALKYDSLSNFFDSVLDGTAKLDTVDHESDVKESRSTKTLVELPTHRQQAAFTAATISAAQHESHLYHLYDSETQSAKVTSQNSVAEPSSSADIETSSIVETGQVSPEISTTHEGADATEAGENTSADPTPAVSHSEKPSQGTDETEQITTTPSAASSIVSETTVAFLMTDSKIDRPVDEL